jgi:RNA polymerase sigma-70 factor (ECF subfamily)
MTTTPNAPLTQLFFAHWRGVAPTPLPNLEALLQDAFEEGRATWPTVRLRVADFVVHVAERLPAKSTPAAELPKIRAGDLFIAAACARGEPTGLAELERHFLTRLPQYLGRLARSPEIVDDTRQSLRERLFVAEPGGRPKIAEYDGRGALGAWLRVTATRLALNARRGEQRRDAAHDRLADASEPTPDPELDYLKARHRGDFEAAFKAALGALPRRDRTLLRMHYMDGVGIGQLAALYSVHRVTMGRWLADAQHAALEETRNQLGARLGLPPERCQSLIVELKSRFAITLHSALSDRED